MTFPHRFIHANGLRHHVVERGQGPLVVLLHGFPEHWGSWRHQIRALADAGYRVVAPDARGCGETEAPEPVEAYATRQHVADVIGLLDALGEPRATLVGHDTGAVTAWRCALRHPDRVAGVASLTVPFAPRPPTPPLEALRAQFGQQFFYILYFQEPGVAEAELEADVARSLRLFYYAVSGEASPAGTGLLGKPLGAGLLDGMIDPPELPGWLGEADLADAAKALRRSGFRGALHRYRNLDRDWQDSASDPEVVAVPALYVTGERDLGHVFDAEASQRMRQWVPELLDAVVLPGAGHWVQQERPEETNAALLRFLGRVHGG